MEPWEIKIDDKREDVDKLYNFIIFTEDSVSEKYYLEWFQNNDLKVTVIADQKSGLQNIKNIIHHCEINELITKKGKIPYIIKEGFYIWGVFDRDAARVGDDAMSDIDFNIAIDYAINAGFNIAWSNDCFELWVLLHFLKHQEILHLNHRDLIYKELSKIFYKFTDKSIPEEKFNYKHYFKKRDRFISVVREKILPRTTIAIEESRHLLSTFDNENRYSSQNPSTTIHELVEKLLSLGQKNISN